MPSVSVGMPVYNDAKFLSAALDSILAQSFTDFELIISDDCSTDGSKDICLKYADLDPRITYIRQNNNLGISKNMMYLLQIAKGDYFMWAGNDDLWHPEFIGKLVHALQQSATCVSAFGPYIDIDENGNPVSRIKNINYANPDVRQRLTGLIKIFNDAFGYGLFVRKKILDVKFPVWWGSNKICAYDNIFPTLCYYLAKGDFCYVKNVEPLWYNRFKTKKNINHKIPFHNNFILGYFAYAVRKLNLVWISAKEIYRAEKNIRLVLSVFPRLFFSWFLIPVFYKIHTKYHFYKIQGPEIFI